MRVFRDDGQNRAVVANSDEVLADIALPANSKVNNVWLEAHILGPEDQSGVMLYMYAMSAYVIPVLDPDTPVDIRDYWDRVVPKSADIATSVFDMDTGANDAGGDYEIGEIDFQELFDLNVLDPKQMFRRIKRISVASNATGYVAGTPDSFRPVDFFKTQIKRGKSVNQPSMGMVGLSSPDLTDTTNANRTTPSETDWIKLQYIDTTFQQMLDYLVGLTSEGTGTSPYDEAAALIAEYVAPDYYEATGGRFAPVTWDAFLFATWDVSIRGKLEVRTLSSGD